ncbi:MAG: hypothetical protein ACK5X3_05335 [Pseudomonadota bacterium]
MTMTITFTGDWAHISTEMRRMLGITATFEITYDGQNTVGPNSSRPGGYVAAEPVAAEAPAPRTRRKKAETQVADEPVVEVSATGVWTLSGRDSGLVQNNAPEPVFESTVATPLVEEPVPSVDAPVETQASTSEAGSDAPVSGTATPASDVTYADVVKAVTDLAKAKGGAAVKAALGEMGLTTAKDTAPDVWPAIIDAMREAM